MQLSLTSVAVEIVFEVRPFLQNISLIFLFITAIFSLRDASCWKPVELQMNGMLISSRLKDSRWRQKYVINVANIKPSFFGFCPKIPLMIF